MSTPHKPSKLDANQVLQHSFDEETQRLRVDAESTIVNADINVSLDASEDSVSIADDQGRRLQITTDGTMPVTNSPFSSPKGADTIYVDKSLSIVDVVYYKQNGLNGTILKTIRITYTSIAKQDIESVEIL